MNLAEPPKCTAAKRYPELDEAFMIILGLQSTADFDEMVLVHEQQRLPTAVMRGSCPSRFDPTHAPAGEHSAFMWQKVPFRLRGSAKNWDAEADAHGQRMLQGWTEYAPNLEGAVLASHIRPAHDIPRLLPNMQDADLLIRSLGHGQVGYDCPFLGAGHYRGHLPGLYLCGSSCHPSGNVTGLPGYNATQVLLADLGLPTLVAS